MSDLPIKSTFKSGAGFDAPWLTIDANDPTDLALKLDAIIASEVLTKVIAVADLFKAANTAGPLVTPEPQQAAPVQQQNAGWGSSPQPTQPQWPQPQQAAPQASHPNAQLHPEGKACEFGGCGKVLEFKKSSGGKGKFQCPEWRWQNGNPNGHAMEWQN